ncbi:MAG: polysaccharide pyruvyl transferase family protein, partial [Deltaproteobacteria bacterium]|nr:polysaccharide pyruvyl transferase family protein [Deltaproteobacteria bacterium]
KKVEYAKLNNCDLVAVGSILQRLKNHFWTHRVHVWGSGLIEERTPSHTPHHIHAVRGKLTATALKNQKIEALGDPGLLSDILLPKQMIEKRFRVGVVPHYVDQQDPAVIEFLKQPGVIFIDIFSETIDFLEQIARCEIILSSSLHGLIIADALQIPNAWLKLSQRVRGNDYKFTDYYSVFGLEGIQPYPFSVTTTVTELDTLYSNYSRPGLDHIKQQLLKAFPIY